MKENKIGLVLEGGGHRGIYTAGILDVFAENKIFVDAVMGVSAGCVHGASFLSGQIGRSLRYTTKYCDNPNYMGFRSLITTGNFFNEDFCYYKLPEILDPFDNDAFDKNSTQFFAVCTDVKTGNPIYHECESLKGDKIKWLQASASMPLVSKIIKIDDELLLDGGISDSIPIQKMQEMGFEKNIVILTQEKGYTKKANSLLPVIKLFYKKYPKLIEAIENRHIVYNQQLEFLEEQEKLGKVIILRPSEKPVAGRTEKDKEKIIVTYNLGKKDALSMLEKIKTWNCVSNSESV
ncbi:MAG: patatin family protein [Treponemataceae bacterium]|nr:patatin family protein [Treponemataceae bacterium]